MLLDDIGMEMPEFDLTNQESINTWESASLATAENASGQLHVIMGEDCHKGSVYNRIERNAIIKNTDVNQDVDFIDPKSHKHKC